MKLFQEVQKCWDFEILGWWFNTQIDHSASFEDVRIVRCPRSDWACCDMSRFDAADLTLGDAAAAVSTARVPFDCSFNIPTSAPAAEVIIRNSVQNAWNILKCFKVQRFLRGLRRSDKDTVAHHKLLALCFWLFYQHQPGTICVVWDVWDHILAVLLGTGHVRTSSSPSFSLAHGCST